MIYMDNAATTRLSEQAFEAMRPYMMEQYANAAGTYSFAHRSEEEMEKARAQVAAALQNTGVAGTDTETGAASGSAAPENAASGSAAPASGSQALSNGGAAAAGGNAPGA